MGRGDLRLEIVLSNIKILEEKEFQKQFLGSEYWPGSEHNVLKKQKSCSLQLQSSDKSKWGETKAVKGLPCVKS